MNKKFLFAAATAISLGLSGIASAATQINGALSITSPVSTFTATSITFGPANGGVTAVAGDLGPLGTCLTCVTFNTSPFTTASSPATLFTATQNGVSAVVSLASASFAPTFSGATLIGLTITGTGTMAFTGFDTTPLLTFILTANQAGTTFSASASAAASPVPVPGALPLFASGILGLWALGKRRKKQKLDATVA